MFKWEVDGEVDGEVQLEQSEFIEYVQDKTEFAVRAKLSNTAYSLRN